MVSKKNGTVKEPAVGVFWVFLHFVNLVNNQTEPLKRVVMVFVWHFTVSVRPQRTRDGRERHQTGKVHVCFISVRAKQRSCCVYVTCEVALVAPRTRRDTVRHCCVLLCWSVATVRGQGAAVRLVNVQLKPHQEASGGVTSLSTRLFLVHGAVLIVTSSCVTHV